MGSTPNWVGSILRWRGLWFLARGGLVVAYLIGGLAKLSDFPGAVAEQAHFGLHPPQLWAILAIIIEIGGSILILCNRLVWLAAGALAVLTAIATLVAENFWTMQGHARFVAMNALLEHLGLIAGFIMATLLAEGALQPLSERTSQPR